MLPKRHNKIKKKKKNICFTCFPLQGRDPHAVAMMLVCFLLFLSCCPLKPFCSIFHRLCAPSFRHLYLLHVKEELHRGSLRLDAEQAVEFCALLAQADLGDYNQNTAKYCYAHLCGEEPSPATINRYEHSAVTVTVQTGTVIWQCKQPFCPKVTSSIVHHLLTNRSQG